MIEKSEESAYAAQANHHKIEHQLFRAVEELEWDERLAELSGIDAYTARLASLESHLPQSADRMAVSFGMLDSI